MLAQLLRSCRAVSRLGMGVVVTSTGLWCPPPDMLGLQDTFVSQAAALSDEQQLVAVSPPPCLSSMSLSVVGR